MKKLFKNLGMILCAACLSFSLAACDSKDDEPSNSGNNPNPNQPSNGVDLNALPDLWLETHYVEIGAGDNGTDKTTYFDIYSYEFIRFVKDLDDDNIIYGQFLDYPYPTVKANIPFTIKENKLYYNNTLWGTITRCVKQKFSGHNGELVVVWETVASPFNLGSKYKVEAYYWLDDWSDI